MENINTDNPIVKKLEDLIEKNYDEFYDVLCACPSYSIFWNFVNLAFYKTALKRSQRKTISDTAIYLRMNRTTLSMILTRFRLHGLFKEINAALEF